jgi:dGTPase
VAELPPGYSAADAERMLPEHHSTRRSDFARDRARILHSSALRRLAVKTQVLSPTAGLDFARNRITHSL